MNNLRPVIWTKGMFLTPQHFQANETFHAENSHYRFSSSYYYYWGVTEISINQPSLANGINSITRSRGVMPDGLTFSIPDSDEAPDGRSVAEHFQPKMDALDVYLAIPEPRPHGKNVTHNGASGDV